MKNSPKIVKYPDFTDLTWKELDKRNFMSNHHAKSRNGFYRSIKIIDCKNNTYVDYREYWSNAGDCKVLLWVSGADNYYNTSNTATGYGYHKASVALQGALGKAGVEFNRSWGGSDDEAIREALLLVAKKHTKKGKKLILVESFA